MAVGNPQTNNNMEGMNRYLNKFTSSNKQNIYKYIENSFDDENQAKALIEDSTSTEDTPVPKKDPKFVPFQHIYHHSTTFFS